VQPTGHSQTAVDMKPSDDNFQILPTLQYRDSARAIEWLCRAFGFRPQLLVPDERGAIARAQLGYDNGASVLIVATDREFHQLVPSDSTGWDDRIVVVIDLDAHYAQAIGAGAEIVIDIQDDKSGGRSYSCRDLEGHIWHFSSLDRRSI
jgi:uncharacterized glyoxalase superfamily protein PhnB